jgi:hypothetical protein
VVAHTKATTQPINVHPRNKLSIKIADVFVLFFIIATVVGTKYPIEMTLSNTAKVVLIDLKFI